YEAAPNAHPVLRGGKVLTSWTQTTANNIPAWHSGPQKGGSSLMPFSQLWVNGVRRFRPNTSPGKYLYNDNASYNGGATTFSTFYYANSDVSNFYDLGDVEVVDFENWTTPRMRISMVDTTQKLVTLTGT